MLVDQVPPAPVVEATCQGGKSGLGFPIKFDSSKAAQRLLGFGPRAFGHKTQQSLLPFPFRPVQPSDRLKPNRAIALLGERELPQPFGSA